MSKMVSVAGVNLELVERGAGRQLLFLHAGEGLDPNRPWLDTLAKHYRVIAPYHPGFGNSALPDWFATVDDLAYLYLDLARQLDLQDAILVGASFGGWVAAEMAVRNSAALASLTLVGALGIQGAHVAPAIREAMVYANVIGCDLGPKFTPIGSLATLLWLHVLAQKGVRIGWGYYFRVGVLLTTPILLVTLAALALRLTLA